MAKPQHDFKKDWEQTKVQLAKLSKEATKFAKKSEDEILKFSKKSKLHIDSTALSLKKEHLYYQIGKEYAHLKDVNQPTEKLKKLVHEIRMADKEQKELKTKLKPASKPKSKSKKKTASSKTNKS